MPLRRLSGADRVPEACPTGGWPPRLRPPRRGTKLRLDVAAATAALARGEDGVRAAIALSAAYRGERTIVLGLGGIRSPGPAAVGKLLAEACWLLRGWGPEARVELRCLRPAGRRALLEWLPSQHDAVLVTAARRTLVLVPAADGAGAVEAELEGLRGTRRKMLRLAARDGEHCVWCSTPLTHRSAHATVDHVRCRCDGGGNALENLVLSCAACNHRRSNAPADVWLATCLAAGADVDEDAVTAAIRRSERHHRERRHLTLLDRAA